MTKLEKKLQGISTYTGTSIQGGKLKTCDTLQRLTDEEAKRYKYYMYSAIEQVINDFSSYLAIKTGLSDTEYYKWNILRAGFFVDNFERDEEEKLWKIDTKNDKF